MRIFRRALPAAAVAAALLTAACNGGSPRPANRAAPPAPGLAAAKVVPVAVRDAVPDAAPVAMGAGADDARTRGLGAIDEAAAKAIAAHQVPGAVIVIGRHDRLLLERAYGERQVVPDHQAMTVDTLFDLASLTKPVATATSLFVLVDRGLVTLDDALVKFVPECDKGGKAAITLRHLLLHTAGLPAGIPKDDFAHGRDEAVRRICAVPLRGTPGQVSRYSDLSFLLLEEVIRRVTSQDLSAFARAAVFAPLEMTDTGFLPAPDLQRRAAWTELVMGAWRVGVVHDPRAYLLGGVAGHAGLFSTAKDLALYARAILGGGEVDGRRVLSAESVRQMTTPYDVPDGIRTPGWGIDSQWKGGGLSPRAFGHFGWTGTALWIDPEKDLFVLILTNRVHPDGSGDAKPLVLEVATIAARAVGPFVGKADPCDPRDELRLGVDVLKDEGFARLRGAKVGLITNASGRAAGGTPTVDVLRDAPGVTLVELFAPEHGLLSDRQGSIPSGRDERTGLPVYSLYGDAFEPSPESLARIDTMVFDVEDVGTRFFTYASTMRRAMAAAREHGLRFMVLDRPDPIDGVDVAGPVLVPGSRSFVNFHALPVRHGMTIGELAYLFNADDHLGTDLTVVPMRGWARSAYQDQTGLAFVPPSPNLRSVTEEILYPGLGLLEATNLSVGRGTATPFEVAGAPWVDGKSLAEALARESLAGVSWAPTSFTPRTDPYRGLPCQGVRVTITDRAHFDPVRAGLALARALRRLYPDAWEFKKLDHLLQSAAAMSAIDQGKPLTDIEATYKTELSAFLSKRDRYLLYPSGTCAH